MTDRERLGLLAGVLSVAVTNLAILGAVLASPSFRWTGNALSNLGQPGAPVATPVTTGLFDGGLVLGGVIGLPFAWALYRRAGHVLQRLAAPVFALALVGMVGVGVFPQSQPLHLPAAVGFYLLSMLAMTLHGAGGLLSADRRRGAVTLGLTAVHVGIWLWWGASGSVTRPGLAIPEMGGALVVTGWVFLTVLAERRR